MRRLAVVLFVLLGACGGDEAPEDAQPRESRAQVVRSGFSIHDQQVGAGAVIRVNGDQALREIGLRVTFYSDGKRLGAERDSLPFCPPATDCGWGQTLFGENLHKDWASIDRVDVEIADDPLVGEEEAEVVDLEGSADNRRVTVTPTGDQGTVYLVAFEGDAPRGGYSFFTQDGETNELRYSQRIFPRDEGTEVKGYFYPGPIPERVGGPAD